MPALDGLRNRPLGLPDCIGMLEGYARVPPLTGTAERRGSLRQKGLLVNI